MSKPWDGRSSTLRNEQALGVEGFRIETLAGNDPCDEWPVTVFEGRLCMMYQYESGVSPFLGWNRARDRYDLSWRYDVVETGFIPYGVFRCVALRPL